MRKYPNAADGLKLMFYAQIIVIVGAVLSLVPVLGSVIVIVGSIVSLVGLYKTQADDSGYQMAFYVTIASIVVGVIKNFAGNGIFGSLVGIVNTVLNLAIIYYVCTTTSNLLHSVGNEALANRGITVWKIYLVVTIIGRGVQCRGLYPGSEHHCLCGGFGCGYRDIGGLHFIPDVPERKLQGALSRCLSMYRFAAA